LKPSLAQQRHGGRRAALREIAAVVRQKLQDAVSWHITRVSTTRSAQRIPQVRRYFSAKVLCTANCRGAVSEYVRHNPDAVMERNGLTCGARHRALAMRGCCTISGSSCARDVAQPRLAAAVRPCSARTNWPAHLPPAWPMTCPRAGAYRFFGGLTLALCCTSAKTAKSLAPRVLADEVAIAGVDSNGASSPKKSIRTGPLGQVIGQARRQMSGQFVRAEHGLYRRGEPRLRDVTAQLEPEIVQHPRIAEGTMPGPQVRPFRSITASRLCRTYSGKTGAATV